MTTITKQTKHMCVLEFKEVDKAKAKDMVIKNHYSHKWGTAFGVINIGVFRDNQLLGVAVFGHMMNPNSYKSIADIEKNEIIELNRLWISDDLGHNAETITMGACWKILRKDYPHIKLVQSFADGRLGCGTIYKASNFKYYGNTTTLFYENVETKEVKHNALFNDGRHIGSMLNHNTDLLDGKLRAFKVKTYRYIYILDKKVHVKLNEKPYPSYDKGIDYVPIRYSDNLLGKLVLGYNAINDKYHANKALALIKGDSYKILDEQMKHKYVNEFINKGVN